MRFVPFSEKQHKTIIFRYYDPATVYKDLKFIYIYDFGLVFVQQNISLFLSDIF